jgi:DNA-binding beta-propeller fold protein YncE
MILLKGRVFRLALLLVIAGTMPSVIRAQTAMNEIPLGSGGGGASTQSMTGGTLLDGGSLSVSTTGPEAAAFDGTYVWVATQFNNSITRIRVSDGSVAGTFTVGKRPVALLYGGGSLYVANLLSNTVSKVTPAT